MQADKALLYDVPLLALVAAMIFAVLTAMGGKITPQSCCRLSLERLNGSERSMSQIVLVTFHTAVTGSANDIHYSRWQPKTEVILISAIAYTYITLRCR